jgi:hypothetical protein
LIELILIQALKIAEQTYDQVIRRWGNIPFAQSSVYDWVWSEDFCRLCMSLSETDKGQIRLHILHAFGVRPWSWHPPHRQTFPPREY